jgi:Tfp pilus assembly protein PilV
MPLSAPSSYTREKGAGECGLTLIEAIVATLIISLAAAGLLSAFDTARRDTSYSELHNVATQAAERELQRIAAQKWEEIALNKKHTWAPESSSTANPTYYISAAECDSTVSLPNYKPCYEFNWKNTSEKEPLVLGEEGEVDGTADPYTFTTLTASNATRLSVSVYRYITWVDDAKCEGSGSTCFSTSASSASNYKRVTVAATVAGLREPVVLSTLLVNPKGESSNSLYDGATCEEGSTKGVKCTF